MDVRKLWGYLGLIVVGALASTIVTDSLIRDVRMISRAFWRADRNDEKRIRKEK